jgi:hypothetical protein
MLKTVPLLLTVAALGQAATCDSLSTLALPNTTIAVAEVRPAGELTLPGIKPLPGLPSFCRVSGSIKPSSDSDIRFEVWMPAEKWNGKFQGIGNGGYAGSISYGGLADAVRHGYASASTDTGHEDRGESARWALNHPEKITDFGYRAIHETAVTAKSVIRAFYGDAPKRSYFSSCSNGGRQALMEAQRFPADYDGIIAGAPAAFWTHLLSSAASGTKATLADPASYIPAAKLPAIQAAALAQCDAADGVKDGAIENPLACPFDPSPLLCKAEESDACLTAPQLTALKVIYGGLRDAKGRKIFPGLSPGGEAEAGGWADWITGKAPQTSAMYNYSTQFFNNMVYMKDWPFRSFDPERDVKAADERMAQQLTAVNPDLSAFQKRGGKLILYHGWADAAIPGAATVEYYDTVVAKMGADNVGGFMRLYMVPGMEHCGNGAAPNVFGQFGTPNGDRFHNVDAALEAWVEQGTAPEELVAVKFRTNNDPRSGVERTRPLCVWPQVAKYKGTGSTDDARNFVCGK